MSTTPLFQPSRWLPCTNTISAWPQPTNRRQKPYSSDLRIIIMLYRVSRSLTQTHALAGSRVLTCSSLSWIHSRPCPGRDSGHCHIATAAFKQRPNCIIVSGTWIQQIPCVPRWTEISKCVCLRLLNVTKRPLSQLTRLMPTCHWLSVMRT